MSAPELATPLEAAVAAFADALEAHSVVEEMSVQEAGRLGAAAADIAVRLPATGTSLFARRIGAVYTVDALTRWLVAPNAPALSAEAVRKRARQRRLVAFRTDDDHLAYPEWQFSRAAGRLVPRSEVIDVWNRLPHDGFLTDVDLAAWMSTPLDSLGSTPTAPAVAAHAHGADWGPLVAAVARLRARAA